MEQIRGRARELGVWVVLGPVHRLGGGHKPHNSVYVIDRNGEIVDCTTPALLGDPRPARDLAHYPRATT